MNKRETLVILTPGFPADEADTACIPPQQVFVKALKERHPELEIVVLTLQYPYAAGEYDWHGIPVTAFGGCNKGQLNRAMIWLKVWMKLRQLKRTRELTGLLSFWLGECAFIGNRFARKYKLKHYCWMLGQDAREGNTYVKRIKPDGSCLIALSDNLAKEFEANYGISPKYIIPPGIDTSLFGPDATERDIDLMGAGSLIPLKQYDVFVDAVKGLTADFPNLKATICGKGPELEPLQKQIQQFGLERNIELKGELPHTEVLALMQRSKVFLHTSAYEGFGAVISEALYAGAHVVSLVYPMNELPGHYYKADGLHNIVSTITGLLKDGKLNHEPVLIYSIDTITGKIAGLYL